MSIWLQKSALIQPRTSIGKSDVCLVRNRIVFLVPYFDLSPVKRWGRAGGDDTSEMAIPVFPVEKIPILPVDHFGLPVDHFGRSNFGGLVLGCINADFCNQILILQHFSRSTRFKLPRWGVKKRLAFCSPPKKNLLARKANRRQSITSRNLGRLKLHKMWKRERYT